MPSLPVTVLERANHGVKVEPRRLEAADPYVRHDIDTGESRHASDQQRGWLYFDLVLTYAGVEVSEKTQAALADLQVYHADQNLWETVPPGVSDALDAFGALGLKLVVVSFRTRSSQARSRSTHIRRAATQTSGLNQ